MQYKYSSAIGDIFISADEKAVTYLNFHPISDTYGENEIIRETVKQLDEYFSYKRIVFNIPINPIGTDFQKRVWNALKTIPYGKTCSYKDIAVRIGSPKAYRAIGSANNKNPILIIIPCHRVIGSNKKLVGYAGGLDIKQKLLNLENLLVN